MIASLMVVVPANLVVPEEVAFTGWEHKDGPYSVRALPPGRSDRPLQADAPEGGVRIDGKSAFIADALRFEFQKDQFDRTPGAWDPPQEVIRRTVDSLILRLRYVARAHQLRPIAWDGGINLHLRYLNDDGSELVACTDNL